MDEVLESRGRFTRDSAVVHQDVFELEARKPFILPSHEKSSNLRHRLTLSSEEHRRLFKHTLRWIVPLLVAFGLPLGIGLSSIAVYQSDSGCLPDGTLRLIGNPQTWWSLDGLFAITLPFGSFSFTAVKVIDEAWDIVIGRCGQIFATILPTRVFLRVVLFSMESSLVTCETFATTAFNVGSAQSIWIYFKSVYPALTSSKDASINAVLMAFASIYPMMFATLASAMTGYQTTIVPYFTSKNGTNVVATSLEQITVYVPNANRLGFTANLSLTEDMLQNGWRNISHYYYSDYKNYTDIYINDVFYNFSSLPLEVFYSHDPVNWPVWSYQNQTYDSAWLKKNGTLATLAFILSVYALSLRTLLYSRSATQTKGFGKYKATLTLAKAICGNLGDKAEQLPEQEIEDRLKRRNGGLQIDVDGLPLARRDIMLGRAEEERAAEESRCIAEQKKRTVAVRERLDAIDAEAPGTMHLLTEYLTYSR